MFAKILIANRGEIACRVAATARKLGIKTVAVYSEADAQAKHVQVCDEAFCLGPAEVKLSYLCADKILAIAKATGAQAIHPGYGFLSENAEFALACEKAGIVFIGPPARSIDAMGSKSAAKTLMEKAGVPLVPGYHGDNQNADFIKQEADKIGYPVLLKASAGGGGKGMRIVEKSEDFLDALASCQREAINAFGDDKVLVEKYLTRPRHIEIQIFADQHDNCVYLFERDCSVQRRHQKVMEEAPAPGMSSERRKAMGQAAVAAAKAVGYVGAGTVEFIANQDGSFYFMEMNTRLQVEHPVTEMITGTDLVEWQLRVAAHERLPLLQDDLRIHGHALEARVYAENPEKGFLPSIGTLHYMNTPSAVNFAVGGDANQPASVRIDSGVREGDDISPFYDPMIAKLIVWGKDRSEALTKMSQALDEYRIVGLHNNIPFLKRLVKSTAFSNHTGHDLDTGLIAKNHATLFPEPAASHLYHLALASMSVLHPTQPVNTATHNDPWSQGDAWRMNHAHQRCLQFSDERHAYAIYLTYQTPYYLIQHGDTSITVRVHSCVSSNLQTHLQLQLQVQDTQGNTCLVQGSIIRLNEHISVFSEYGFDELHYHDALLHAGDSEEDGGSLTAPMPGKIVAVMVEKGQTVKKGDALLIMEAMKMEHTIAAPRDGTVEDLLYAVGDQVTEGVSLLSFK